jgi:hypothetical protein
MDLFRYYYTHLCKVILEIYVNNPHFYNREISELKNGFPEDFSNLINDNNNYYNEGHILLCNYKGRKMGGVQLIELDDSSKQAISAYYEARKKLHISSNYVFCNILGEKLQSYQISQILKKACGNTSRDFKAL